MIEPPFRKGSRERNNTIGRARQRDEAAWTALVRRHQEAAFRLAYLILREADEAEDVAQGAFIRAFRWLDPFDAGRPFRPWLLGITKNLAYNLGLNSMYPISGCWEITGRYGKHKLSFVVWVAP